MFLLVCYLDDITYWVMDSWRTEIHCLTRHKLTNQLEREEKVHLDILMAILAVFRLEKGVNLHWKRKTAFERVDEWILSRSSYLSYIYDSHFLTYRIDQTNIFFCLTYFLVNMQLLSIKTIEKKIGGLVWSYFTFIKKYKIIFVKKEWKAYFL